MENRYLIVILNKIFKHYYFHMSNKSTLYKRVSDNVTIEIPITTFLSLYLSPMLPLSL